MRLNNDPFDTYAGFHVSDFDAALHAIDESLNEISNGQSNLATFQLPQPSMPRPGSPDPLDSEIMAQRNTIFGTWIENGGTCI